MQDCKHCPIVLDEAPNSAAPTLVVCQICQDVIEALAHEKPQYKVRYILRMEEVQSPA